MHKARRLLVLTAIVTAGGDVNSTDSAYNESVLMSPPSYMDAYVEDMRKLDAFYLTKTWALNYTVKSAEGMLTSSLHFPPQNLFCAERRSALR